MLGNEGVFLLGIRQWGDGWNVNDLKIFMKEETLFWNIDKFNGN